MKHDDYILKGGKAQITFLFSFSISKLLSFFVPIMSVEKSCVDKLQKQFFLKVQKLKE
jgi:hypothetical protein